MRSAGSRAGFLAGGVMAMLAAGCASTLGWSSLKLDVASMPAELRPLAEKAQAGDKQAQLALGVAYEEGRGVPEDRERARMLYRMAAQDEPGTQWVYAPSPGGGAPAMVMPIKSGVPQMGLKEAGRRLKAMETKE